MTASTAFAVEQHVCPNSFATNTWSYRPIYTSGASPQVTAILALASADNLVGGNLAAVLYQKTNGVWNASSWPNTTAVEAVKSVKSMLLIPASEDSLWGIPGDLSIESAESQSVPSEYSGGLLVGDPLHDAVAGAPNSAEVVQFLVDVGYEAAAVTIEADPVVCPIETQLDAMSLGAEWALSQNPNGEEQQSAVLSGMTVQFAAAACAPGPCTPGEIGVWAVGPEVAVTGGCGYILVGSTWTPNTGGGTFVCNYEVRKYFTQTRSVLYRRGDCTTYTCRQMRTNYGWAAIACSTWVPTGNPLPTCTAQPQASCAGPATGSTVCAAAASTVQGAWGPPCQQ